MSDSPSVKKYALVKEGAVTTVLYTEEGFIENVLTSEIVDITNHADVASIESGYLYAAGEFIPPA